jgi:Domain of unknown function (DUF4347)
MPGIDIDVVSDGRDSSGNDGFEDLLSLRSAGTTRPSPRTHQSMLAGMRSNLPRAIIARNVHHMVMEISARLRAAPAASRQIGLLRIFCHGVPGQAFIGCGNAFPGEDQQILGVDNQGALLNGSDLRRIRGLFGSDGLVTIHGCSFANGALGRKALNLLSAIWSVRIRASAADQVAQMSGAQFVSDLQPPVLEATNVTPGAFPETPMAAQWQ